jgi:hypothetical protein
MSGIASFLSSPGGTHTIEFPSLRLFNSRQRASSFLVANLNRRRFAAYRKRDEKSQRRDDQTGNLPFINRVTGSGKE